MKIHKVNQIDVEDWDNLITSHYGKIYSFQQQDCCKSRGVECITVPTEPDDYENTELPFELTEEEMGISFETWLNTSTEDTEKYFKNNYENEIFWERNFYPHISMLINDLHSKGLLEPGEYQIKIDW